LGERHGQRRFKLHKLTRLRVRESQLLCMQELAVEAANARAQGRVLDRVVAAATVSLITDNRMLQPREMHSDLMRSSRLELNIEKRETIKSPPHAKERQRIASPTHHGHTRSVRRIT